MRCSSSSPAPIVYLRGLGLCLLHHSRVDLDCFRDDRLSRGYAECRLEEADDAPDRDHDENRDDTPEHGLQAFAFLLPDFPQIPYETPEEDVDRKRDEKIDEGVE